jgi:hypothetical protein
METIKASELYIDKYYYQVVDEYEPCTPKIIKWNQSNWYAIGECIEFIEWFEPIPLTEEWLLKFGFKGEKGIYHILICEEDKRINKKELRLDVDDDGWYVDIIEYDEQLDSEMYSINISKIKHVHQLQNLYFTLTGQELEFKQ